MKAAGSGEADGGAMWLNGANSGDDYEAVFEQRDAAGEDVHGEASFVQRFAPRSVLDAGCGTGRVARELARRGVEVVGVDRDPDMLATARRKAPHLDWRLDDLRVIDLGRTFDVVLLAGNVMIFLAPGSESDVVAAMARHLAPSGLLIAGFQLDYAITLDQYDALAAAAGLRLAERYATWAADPWMPGGDYAVSVHLGQHACRGRAAPWPRMGCRAGHHPAG